MLQYDRPTGYFLTVKTIVSHSEEEGQEENANKQRSDSLRGALMQYFV